VNTCPTAERSYQLITVSDLARLAELAAADRADRFARRPRWQPYADRLLCTALCQGAAKHYVDRQNGVKDFDVYSFYAEDTSLGRFPPRWHTTADFGPSRFGRHPDDNASYTGRRIDFIGRSLKVSPDVDPVEALIGYLTQPRTETARHLPQKGGKASAPMGSREWAARPSGRLEPCSCAGRTELGLAHFAGPIS
jgi:hypothetical protein